MSMQNITLFKVPLWKNDYHRFCIQSKFTGWYRSGFWHELGTIEILVIAGQISAQAGDVTLPSWRKRCEGITELGWLTLCSPPLAENSWILADCPYWDCGCELFKDINNWGILASCWQSFFASLTRNSSNLRSLSAFSFNWHSNLLPCAAIEPFIPRAIAGKPCVVDLIFSNSLCGGLTIFDFFRNGISLSNILMNSFRCIIVSLFVFSVKVIQISAIRSTGTCRLAFIIVVITMFF